MMGRLAGKVAIVTGAASGIGRAIAARFAAEGAAVVGGDLNADGLATTVALCRDAGGEAACLRTDVTREEDVAALVAHAIETFGGLDIMVNNAGASGATGPIESIPVDDWDRTLHIGLRSVFLGMKHAVPALKARGGGAIVSTASIVGERGIPGLHGYCAAKAAVINLTRSVAIELGEHGIRVNCVCPGEILTPMRASPLPREELERQIAGMQPLERAGWGEDVAGAALFLASDDAGWVTGVALPVDGGALSGIWSYTKNTRSYVMQPGFLGPSFLRTPTA